MELVPNRGQNPRSAEGAILPLPAIGLFGSSVRIAACVVVMILALGGLSALGARLGGAAEVPALTRVVFWGVIAMGATSAIGALVGSAV